MSDLKIVSTVCPLDCPDTCQLRVGIENGRMVSLTGAKEHPITQGFACVKMSKYPLRQHHPDRLSFPQKRVGEKGSGEFERISWDEALDTITQRLQSNIEQFGETSVLPFSYAGTMGLIEGEHPHAFFRALGASELDWTICAATAGAGWEANYGPDKISTAPEDTAHSKLIILWGINALRSNSHLVPFLKQARRSGAHILHIDPYRNETSRFADQHWQIAVGTDTAMALALGGEILRLGGEDREFLDAYAQGLSEYKSACAEWTIERAAELCGIPANDIRQLAQQIAAEPATFIKVGYGMSRNEGGGNAIRAITLLPALTGAWKHKGGGAALSTSGAFGFNMSRFSGAHLLKPQRPHINQNQFGLALHAGPKTISTLFVYNSNPAAVAPDSNSVCSGLRREDLFTVVLEHFQTDTADYADILLPATTFLEHPDLYKSYGHYHLQWAEPVLKPLDECRPNSWVFQTLAKRLGLRDPVLSMTAEQLAGELLTSDHPYLKGISFTDLQEKRDLRLNLPQDFRPYANGSHFADRKIRFGPPPQQIDFVEQPSAKFPLRLISPPGPYILNTSMGNLAPIIKAAGGEPTVLVHPEDARTYRIEDGKQILVESPNGSIQRKAIVSSDARQGVVVVPGQWWPKLAPDRKSLNELTSQGLTDLGGGSLFGNVVVCIKAVEATPCEAN